MRMNSLFGVADGRLGRPAFPVLRDNTAVQTVADYRLQAALNAKRALLAGHRNGWATCGD